MKHGPRIRPEPLPSLATIALRLAHLLPLTKQGIALLLVRQMLNLERNLLDEQLLLLLLHPYREQRRSHHFQPRQHHPIVRIILTGELTDLDVVDAGHGQRHCTRTVGIGLRNSEVGCGFAHDHEAFDFRRLAEVGDPEGWLAEPRVGEKLAEHGERGFGQFWPAWRQADLLLAQQGVWPIWICSLVQSHALTTRF